jgi:hypothetical protein
MLAGPVIHQDSVVVNPADKIARRMYCRLADTRLRDPYGTVVDNTRRADLGSSG